MGNGLKLAVCLDDGGGMLFGGRRQSRDRALIAELCDTTPGLLYITEFSTAVFAGHDGKTVVTENPFTDAPDGATVFIENIDALPYIHLVDEIILYKWNRAYPRDKCFDVDLGEYKVVAKKSFVGSSHDKITKLRLKR